MKKKLSNLVWVTLIICLINTGLLGYLVSEKIAFDVKNKPVLISQELDKGQSYELAKQTGKPMIVWFYTDWCGYCQKFAPIFKKVTKHKAIKEKFAVAYVNAEDENNKELVKEYDVEGYPTLYIVNGDEKKLIEPQLMFVPKAEKGLVAKFLEIIE